MLPQNHLVVHHVKKGNTMNGILLHVSWIAQGTIYSTFWQLAMHSLSFE